MLWASLPPKQWAALGLFVLATGLITFGAFLVYKPAAPIVAGLLVLLESR
jgi:hypothetical protein